MHDLCATSTGVQQHQQQRSVARADRLVAAGGKQCLHLLDAEWFDDPLREADVLHAPKRAAFQVVEFDQPVEEAAHLPEVAVAGLQAVLPAL